MQTSICAFRFLVPFLLALTPDWMTQEPYSENFTNMEASELSAFCQKWDTLLETDELKDGHPMISNIVGLSEATPFGSGVRILRYRNPEIITRVVKLFVAEYQYKLYHEIKSNEQFIQSENQGEDPASCCARDRAWLSESIATHGNLFENLPMNDAVRFQDEDPDCVECGESELDYEDILFPAAYTTFDPSIYDEVWRSGGGGLHNVYLTTVYPDRTLDLLLSVVKEPSTWRLSNGQGIGEIDAFELLLLLCKQQPALISQRLDGIRSFVKENALHYSENRVPDYLDILDFILRRFALNILKIVGNNTDIDYIHELGNNPPTKLPPETYLKSSELAISWSDAVASAISAIQSRAAVAPAP